MKFGIILALSLAAVPALAAADDGAGVTGRWLTQDGKGVIAIAPCGDSICGRIDWMKPSRDSPPDSIPRDRHNPDPARRQEPICGLQIIYGFHRDGDSPDSWVAGAIYDPDSGNLYHANIKLMDPHHLELRGYIGIPLLGQSQVWTRVGPGHPACHAG